MSYVKRKEIIVVILCLLIGFALRFYTFDKKSLWLDEIYTFNDSRDDFKAQINYFKDQPTNLHPPLFFILTHLFYPFEKPERDLRIIPLIFGILSIPTIYLLARQFSPSIALPCTLSLTLMTYHISLSQEGRSYTLIMFLGMVGLYFFVKHLNTLKRIYLPFAAFFLGLLFYISYSSISFIFFSQILWLYRTDKNDNKSRFSSFFMLNGSILLVCLPWILFIAFNYKHQPLMDPYQEELIHSFWEVLYWMLHDWTIHLPLMILSAPFLALLPIWSKYKRNGLIFLGMIFLPLTTIYCLCYLLKINHFFSSRYFINFLPIFLISLYLSILNLESRIERLKRFVRPNLFFLAFFIMSNLAILPLYYQSEKMNLRGLANYLKGELKEGDVLFDSVKSMGLTPGILHYFGTYPKGRQYVYMISIFANNEMEFSKSFTYQNKEFFIYHSGSCCNRYIQRRNRVWLLTDKLNAVKLKNTPGLIPKGFFDGSYMNDYKFPFDASIYLFLLDPKSPNEKGIDLPVVIVR